MGLAPDSTAESPDSERRQLLKAGTLALAASTLPPAAALQPATPTPQVETQASFSQEWPMVNNTLDGSSRNPNSRVPDQNTSISMETSKKGFDSNSHTVFDENNIYIGDRVTGELFAFDRETGNKVWENTLGGSMGRPVAVGPNNFYASTGGKISAFDKSNGNLINTQSIPSTAEAVYDNNNGNVIAPESIGYVSIFEEDLSNQRTFPRPGDVNIARESTMVNDAGNIIYAERDSEAHLRMLDPGTANELDSVPLGNVEGALDGATLHNGSYIFHEDQGILEPVDLVAREVNNNSFGQEAWRIPNVGEDENSPVQFGKHIIGGNRDGEIYTVNTETGDKTIIDKLANWVLNFVAGEHTIAVSEVTGEQHLYDLNDVVDGNKNKISFNQQELVEVEAVADDLLYGQFFDGNNVYLGAVDGDYRSIDPPNLDLGIDTGPDNVYGDTFTVSNNISGETRADSYTLNIVDSGSNLVSSSSYVASEVPDSWDVKNILKSSQGTTPLPDTYTVELEALRDGSVVATLTDAITLEPLETTVTPATDSTGTLGARLEPVSSTDDAVSFGTVTVNGTSVALESGNVFDPSGVVDPGQEFTVTYTAAINSVEYQMQTTTTYRPPPLPGYDTPPQDLDGDGLFEDLTGTASTAGDAPGIADVVALFENLEREEVQSYPALYRFNAPETDDPDRVGIGDVVALFEQV